MNKSIIILGLGNPDEYEGTRHNLGRDLVKKIGNSFTSSNWDKKGKVMMLESLYEDCKIYFLISLGYMNTTGEDFKSALKSLPKSDLIVVQDDLDLSFGQIKVSVGKGSGGHKGVESLIRMLSSKDFIRIRIGIGRPKGQKTEDYVLGKAEEVKGVEEKIVKFIKTFIKQGIDEATKLINTKN